MLGVVVPIKPKAFSKDWEYELKLLERTVRSICAQTCDNFKLVIVYNEKPEINFKHKNIIYLHYPYPAVSADEIEDLEFVLKYYNKVYAERMFDKGKKIHYGCKELIDAGCQYIISVDSDDLISKNIAQFVDKYADSKKPGWRITKGFIYNEDSLTLIKQYGIQNINGSTHIIRKDLITIPDFATNIFWNYSLFEAHGYTYGRIKQFHNEILDDYPFFGVIYIAHKNNYSNITNLTKITTIKNVVKLILRGKILSKKIREEYSLYKLPK